MSPKDLEGLERLIDAAKMEIEGGHRLRAHGCLNAALDIISKAREVDHARRS